MWLAPVVTTGAGLLLVLFVFDMSPAPMNLAITAGISVLPGIGLSILRFDMLAKIAARVLTEGGADHEDDYEYEDDEDEDEEADRR